MNNHGMDGGMMMTPPPSSSSSASSHNTTTMPHHGKMMMMMHMSFYWGKNAEILFAGWPGTHTAMYYCKEQLPPYSLLLAIFSSNNNNNNNNLINSITRKKRSRMALEGRKIGVAMDFSKGSKAALKWAMDGLLKKGDNLFVINIQHSQALESRNLMWSNSGSPLIPLAELCDKEVMHGYGVEVEPDVLEMLRTISAQLEVNVVWKIYWGDAREKVCEAVVNLHLDTLVMGSRGLGSIRRVLLGSVTSYVLEHATCPVTVVKDRGSEC